MTNTTPPAELLPALDELAELLADAVVRVMVAEKAAKLPRGSNQRVEFSTPAQPQEATHAQ